MAPDGRTVFYLVGGELRSVDTCTCEEKTLRQIEGVTEWIVGPYRIHLSNAGSISADGRSYITSRHMTDGRKVILRYHTDGTDAGVIYEHPQFPAHVQYEPYESKRITFCSAPDPKGRNIWTVDDDGTNLRALNIKGSTGHFMWMRDPPVLQPHSCQAPPRLNSKRILSTLVPSDWALVSCAEDEPEPKIIARGKNFWHAAVSPDGEWIISDTNWPDEGLQLVQVRTGKYKTLCYPRSSQGHPQWTHPHPAFSLDGKVVVFNSDRTGTCQVYLAKITEEFLRSFDG
jgi:Tol biopolymer transport system component